ncbi:unnamed protein product [Orchesella dallaii]|uniref:Uncharacterized protein n=1 Tax=Orchesella dallaii TaxID=48710 RepID=A0ABP1PQG9_9HEXA
MIISISNKVEGQLWEYLIILTAFKLILPIYGEETLSRPLFVQGWSTPTPESSTPGGWVEPVGPSSIDVDLSAEQLKNVLYRPNCQGCQQATLAPPLNEHISSEDRYKEIIDNSILLRHLARDF